MITGYQRQHRKAASFVPIYGADTQTTDQYTRILSHVMSMEGMHEAFSKACELATISGMVLMQPYLDFGNEDQAQGELKLKIWEYNSFLVDPFFRKPDMSDANFVWCQEYITKNEAVDRFGEEALKIAPLGPRPQNVGKFYFLPENYNTFRTDLMVLSYVWYKSKAKQKRIFSKTLSQFFEFAGKEDIEILLEQNIPDLEIVNVEVPTWKVAVVLNDQLIALENNPLKTTQCPFIPVFWNYSPEIADYSLRVRSLIRAMRDPQFLFNYKVLSNNDIAAATINSGWKRKLGAVANEDNLKQSQAGYDILINPGFELTDIEKIQPSIVPPSDLELARQMQELTFSLSGIDMENWSGQQDKQISALTLVMKQAANLMVFQKYFDQWDYSLKLLGESLLSIILYNWNYAKISLLIGEVPTPFFFSKIFCKYQTVVEEALLTPTQKNLQAQQMLDINAAFGREVLPPSLIIPNMNLQGKAEIMKFLEKQEQQASQMQEMEINMTQSMEQARLQELYSKAVSNLAMARERHGRTESNIGLFEERLSEITRNRALATKDKMEALEKLIDVTAKFGQIETQLGMEQIDDIEEEQEDEEDEEKQEAKQTSLANQFVQELMSQMPQGQQGMQQNQPNQEMVLQ